MSEKTPETTPTTTPESLSGAKTLDQIPKGRLAVVIGVMGDDPIARRLGDLGVRQGVQVQMIRRAPLGDPTVYELCSYQLCLRRSESARVQVREIASPLASRPEPDRP